MTVTVSGSFHDPSYPDTYTAEKKRAATEAFDAFVEALRESGFVVDYLSLGGAISHSATVIETPVSEPLPDGEGGESGDSEE